MDNTISYADMVRAIREEQGISQRVFAQMIGSNQTEVSFIERGFIPESEAKLEAIRKIYANYSK